MRKFCQRFKKVILCVKIPTINQQSQHTTESAFEVKFQSRKYFCMVSRMRIAFGGSFVKLNYRLFTQAIGSHSSKDAAWNLSIYFPDGIIIILNEKKMTFQYCNQISLFGLVRPSDLN